MSSERDKPDNDERVADTYRSLATERAPDRLNQAVLRMAARATEKRYPRTIAWLRPMAWAATIGLSLAIVLEITNLPQPEPGDAGDIIESGSDVSRRDETPAAAVPPRPAAASRPGDNDPSESATEAARSANTLEDDFVPQSMEVLREAEDMARTRAGPEQPPVDARADVVTTRGAQIPPGQESPQPGPDASAPLGTVTTPAMQKDTAAAAEKNVRLERPSPSRAASRVTPDAAVVSDSASFAVVAEPESTAVAAACPAAVRESAGSWLLCIARLRELGEDDLADIELDEFRKKYPDLAGNGPDR